MAENETDVTSASINLRSPYFAGAPTAGESTYPIHMPSTGSGHATDSISYAGAKFYFDAYGNIEYDLFATGGASHPIQFEGATQIEVLNGKLVIYVDDYYTMFSAPISFGSQNEEVWSHYETLAEDTIRFQTDPGLDTVRIDPIWLMCDFMTTPPIDCEPEASSLYIGASGARFHGAEFLDDGSVLMSIGTQADIYPTAGVFNSQKAASSYGIGIVKFNSQFSNRVFATWAFDSAIGSYVDSLETDESGNIYIMANERYPAPNGVAIRKISSDGSQLLAAKKMTHPYGFTLSESALDQSFGQVVFTSSFHNGINQRYGYVVAMDNDLNIKFTRELPGSYIVDPVASTSAPGGDVITVGNLVGNMALVDPWQETTDEYQGFVIRLERNTGNLLFSTYLGSGLIGSGPIARQDIAADVDVNQFGQVAIVGTTTSYDFPITADAYQKYLAGGQDQFLVLADAGMNLQYATYMGGVGLEGISAVDWSHDGLSVAMLGSTHPMQEGGYELPVTYPTTINAYSGVSAGHIDLTVAVFDGFTHALTFSTLFGGSSGEAHTSSPGVSDYVTTGSVQLRAEYVEFASYTYSFDYPTSANAYTPSNIFNHQGAHVMTRLVFTAEPNPLDPPTIPPIPKLPPGVGLPITPGSPCEMIMRLNAILGTYIGGIPSVWLNHCHCADYDYEFIVSREEFNVFQMEQVKDGINRYLTDLLLSTDDIGRNNGLITYQPAVLMDKQGDMNTAHTIAAVTALFSTRTSENLAFDESVLIAAAIRLAALELRGNQLAHERLGFYSWHPDGVYDPVAWIILNHTQIDPSEPFLQDALAFARDLDVKVGFVYMSDISNILLLDLANDDDAVEYYDGMTAASLHALLSDYYAEPPHYDFPAECRGVAYTT